jgi:hypothetical protein
MGPRVGLEAVSERKNSFPCPFWESKPCRPARSLLAILTELPQRLKMYIFPPEEQTCYRSHSLVQCLFWKVDSFSRSSPLSWNLEVLSQTLAIFPYIETFQPCPCRHTWFLLVSSRLRAYLANGLFFSGSPLKVLLSISWGLNALLISGEEYKLRSSSLCSFLYISVTFPFKGPNLLFTHTLLM